MTLEEQVIYKYQILLLRHITEISNLIKMCETFDTIDSKTLLERVNKWSKITMSKLDEINKLMEGNKK